MTDGELRIRMQKLSLAYGTGWEYREDTDEPGSVIADVCLTMLEDNWNRFARVWEKQERELLQAMAEPREKPQLLRGWCTVTANERCHGAFLPAGSGLQGVSDTGQVLRFRTLEGITLSAASLQKVFYYGGRSLFEVYGGGEDCSFAMFAPEGEPLKKPELAWRFRNLCNGLVAMKWTLRWENECAVTEEKLKLLADPERTALFLSDGEHTYPVEVGRAGQGDICAGDSSGGDSGESAGGTSPGDGNSDETCPEGAVHAWGLTLAAETPAFRNNLSETVYVLTVEILDPMQDAELAVSLQKEQPVLVRGQGEYAPSAYLTEESFDAGDSVEPFHENIDSFACCYVTCDSAFAGDCGELALCFSETYRVVERLPEAHPAGYEKKMKKYGWMMPKETVLDWKASETVWEYFDGEGWRILPESQGRNDFCGTEARERTFRFHRPADMAACSVEGQEHFYLRIRILQANNAYAQYYRKYIPSLSGMRIGRDAAETSAEPQNIKMVCTGDGEYGEGMYFLFDREVPEDGRLYMGLTGGEERFFVWKPSPEERLGVREIWGIKGFFLFMEAGLHPGKERVAGFWNNPVEFLQREDASLNPEDMGGIPAETPLTLEGEWELAAIAAQDAGLGGSGRAVSRLALARSYISSAGRVVTREDVRRLLEAYCDGVSMVSCEAAEENGRPVLTVRLDGGGGARERERTARETAAFLRGRLAEEGAWWLAAYDVRVEFAGEAGGAAPVFD